MASLGTAGFGPARRIRVRQRVARINYLDLARLGLSRFGRPRQGPARQCEARINHPDVAWLGSAGRRSARLRSARFGMVWQRMAGINHLTWQGEAVLGVARPGIERRVMVWQGEDQSFFLTGLGEVWLGPARLGGAVRGVDQSSDGVRLGKARHARAGQRKAWINYCDLAGQGAAGPVSAW